MKNNPYSISKLGTYAQCPKKFEYQYIIKNKVPVPKNIALYKGSHIHEMLENNFDYDIDFKTNEVYTDTEKQKSIEILKKFEDSELGQKYKKIIAAGTLEEDFAFKITPDGLKLCDFWDGDAWCRGSADVYIRNGDKGFIFDYKTGKDKSKDETFGIEQSMMYAIYMFLNFPDIKTVKAIFCFVEHSTEKEVEYNREGLQSYIKNFYNLTKEVEEDEHYSPKIGPLCDYCDFWIYGICKVPEETKLETEDFMNSKIEF